jgi:hypothetical protein
MERIVWAGAAFAMAIGLTSPAAAQPGDLQTYELSGTVGTHRIGMSLTIRGAAQVWVAHYFYDSQLKDIVLVGSESGPVLTLMEPEGGLFKLKLRGNGGVGGDGSSLATSVGASGTWTQGAQTLPVKLALDSAYDGAPSAHRYADVTGAGDAGFEARVKRFLDAVLAGNKPAAAALVSYPLAVNGGAHPMSVKSPAQLAANWDRIFTAALLAQLRTAVPHEMFVRNGQAMVAGGAAWFDAKGASAINEP